MFCLKSTMERLLASKDTEITILREEIDRLRDDLDYEKQRADNAVDQILAMNHANGIQPRNGPAVKKPEIDMDSVLAKVMSIGGDVGKEGEPGA